MGILEEVGELVKGKEDAECMGPCQICSFPMYFTAEGRCPSCQCCETDTEYKKQWHWNVLFGRCLKCGHEWEVTGDLVPCPSCGRTHKLTEYFSGGKCRCSSCGRDWEIRVS